MKAPAEQAARKSTREKPERRESTRRTRKEPSTRQRRTPRRAPLPKAKRELLVSVDAGEKRVAVLEDGRVAEVYLERPERRSIAGNIYKGVVDNVLPGMEAAFVEIGLEKNGFLYVDEIVGPELEGRKGARKIQDLISRGQEILVQAVKDPMKTKGARLTTEISLPGRFVVYQPHGEGTGVSRRLDDDERTRLKAILKEVAPKQGGIIVRTAAEGASAEDIERDIDFLERLWKTIEARAKTAKTPTLVYQEAELPLRVTRDLFTGDFEKAYIDHERTHKRIVGYLKKTSPHMVERVVRYKEREPLMNAFGVDAEIKSTLNKRVDLPSGGYLIFDYAEAFTVVDVNTGRFVGSRSKSSGARLEDTITKNNLEAVTEVVRQLRLRDIGGIIVIDFIDMANPKNRQAVEDALRQRARARPDEDVRRRDLAARLRRDDAAERHRRAARGDDAQVPDVRRRRDRRLGAHCRGRDRAPAAHARDPGLADAGLQGRGQRADRVARDRAGRVAARRDRGGDAARFVLVGKEDVHLDHFVVLAQGSLEKLRPEAPFEAGATLSVKLGEVGRHDAGAGIGRVDRWVISVADAAKLVGKSVKVRIERVMEGVAYATLVRQVARSRSRSPPRRRPSGRRARSVRASRTEARRRAEARRAGAEAGETPTTMRSPSDEVEADEAGADAEDGDGAAPKKKTRRGSRGGRRRKKKPADGAAAEGDVEAGEAEGTEPDAAGGDEASARERLRAAAEPERDEVAAEEQPRPTRMPTRRRRGSTCPRRSSGARTTSGDGEAQPKKKTRRGTRGGRNRSASRRPTRSRPDGEPGDVDADVEPETPSEAAEPGQRPRRARARRRAGGRRRAGARAGAGVPSSPTSRRAGGAARGVAAERRRRRHGSTSRCRSGATTSAAAGECPFATLPGSRARARVFRAMSYAIIKVGGKQYRVQEGQSLLVDRLKADEGATFTPDLLFVPDGDGGGVTVTARIVGHERGKKIRIGKYRRRTGYKRHTGFRASLTRIAIESIGAGGATARPKAEPARRGAARGRGEAGRPRQKSPRRGRSRRRARRPSGRLRGHDRHGDRGRRGRMGPGTLDAALAYEREHARARARSRRSRARSDTAGRRRRWHTRRASAPAATAVTRTRRCSASRSSPART